MTNNTIRKNNANSPSPDTPPEKGDKISLRYHFGATFGVKVDFILLSCYTTSRCKAHENQGLSGLPPIPGVK